MVAVTGMVALGSPCRAGTFRLELCGATTGIDYRNHWSGRLLSRRVSLARGL